MIRIERTGEPRALVRNKTRWTREYLHAIAIYNRDSSNRSKRNKRNAENKYKNSQVKEALTDMFSGKCAYCESAILHVGYAHIDHFRPKSEYPELCCEWNNLFLCCARCNSANYKGDKFPLENEGGPLINVCDEEPGGFFEFEFDPHTGTANILPQNIRGETTEQILGLNCPSLVKHRSNIVRKLVYCALQARAGDDEAL